MAVVKVNIYKEELGYDDRRSTLIIDLSAKEKRKAFTEEFMFKFEPESRKEKRKAFTEEFMFKFEPESRKEKRKAFTEEFMFKFEPESKRRCGKRTFFVRLSHSYQ